MQKKSLKRLIQGQNISFDTHQAGDGQEIDIYGLHLEKRFHNQKGKMRFPLFGDSKITASGIKEEKQKQVINEVKTVLKKNEYLKKQLADTIVKTLQRFMDNKVTIDTARESATKIAGFFNLDETFITMIVQRAVTGNQIKEVLSIHREKDKMDSTYQIKQTKDNISISKVDIITNGFNSPSSSMKVNTSSLKDIP